MQAVNIPGFLWFAFLATTLPTGGGDFGGPFGPFLGALAFECSAGIVGLVGVIFFLMGTYYGHDGQHEYGPDHARDIERAAIFFVIALVMGVIASVGAIGFESSAFGTVFPFNPVAGIFGAVRGLCVGLFLLYVGRGFLRKEEQNLGWLGTVLLAAAPAVGSGVFFLLFVAGNPSNPFASPALLSLAFVIAAALATVELVAYAMFLHIYSQALRRLRSGEIQPIPRPAVMYVPYYPVPPYYPTNPWEPAYPQAPPPEGPPPAQPPP
jgi:hypothetical protein